MNYRKMVIEVLIQVLRPLLKKLLEHLRDEIVTIVKRRAEERKARAAANAREAEAKANAAVNPAYRDERLTEAAMWQDEAKREDVELQELITEVDRSFDNASKRSKEVTLQISHRVEEKTSLKH